MGKIFLVYVSPLEEGSTQGRMVDLPMEPQELERLLREFNSDQLLYVEVSDYYGRGYLADCLPEDMDFMELNLLADKLSRLDAQQEISFQGLVVMDVARGEVELPLCRLIDLANSTDCCHVVAEVTNDAQLGRFYVENDFPVIPQELPEAIYEILDYEVIGRKVRLEEGGVFISGCYVVQNSDLDISYSQGQGALGLEVNM